MTSGPPSSKRDLRQDITDQIIRALEQGTAPWQKPWQAGALELPFNPATGKPYRGGNVIQLMIEASSHGYDDPRWLTYRQAQENGWQVRRGEKGTHVEFWQFPDRTAKPGSDGKTEPTKTPRDSFIYRVYTVFNAKQIDGIPRHSPRVRQAMNDNGDGLFNLLAEGLTAEERSEFFQSLHQASILGHDAELAKLLRALQLYKSYYDSIPTRRPGCGGPHRARPAGGVRAERSRCSQRADRFAPGRTAHR